MDKMHKTLMLLNSQYPGTCSEYHLVSYNEGNSFSSVGFKWQNTTLARIKMFIYIQGVNNM